MSITSRLKAPLRAASHCRAVLMTLLAALLLAPAAAQARSSQTFGGTLADQEQRGFVVTASRAGTLDAMLTWQDRSISLGIGCQLEAPPYTGCGTSNRTSDTTAALSSSVTQTSYLILVSNYSGRAGTEAFTLTVLYP